MGRTYVIGKLGKSIKFQSDKWSGIGGDNEAPTLYIKLAELNPDDTFIMIGKSDLRKLKNRPSNIHDAWEHRVRSTGNLNISTPDGWAKFIKDQSHSSRAGEAEYITEHLKGIKVDGGIIFGGPTGDVNFLNKIYTLASIKAGKPELAKTLLMNYGYSAPIYDYLNESMIPWIMLNNDPRYLKLGRDMLNMPKEILSQYDSAKLYKHIKSYDDQTVLNEHRIEYKYAGMEKMFLINTKMPNKNIEKTEKFMIVLNEGENGVSSRYKKLKEYVLDHVEDVAIYGKWNAETIKNDRRFKGSVKFEELQTKLVNVKYSFMISIKDGWVTMKVWELISNGIIPFLHPNYDEQCHVKVPEFLRLSKPEDLHSRIEELENNPAKYQEILQQCFDLITERDITGEAINDTILSTINKYPTPIKSSKSYDDVLQEIADNTNDLSQFFG